ncbi:MAG: ABC transporter permease [Asgard group archaeon]|nr:ABC transporter permease [Asgard group archaeon]
MLRFVVRFFFHNRKRTFQAIITLTLALVIYIATVLLVGGYAANISGMASIVQPSNFLLITEGGQSLSESRIDLEVLSFLEEYSEKTPNVDIILPQLYFEVSVVGETEKKINTHLRLLNFTTFELYQRHSYSYTLITPDKDEIIMGQQLKSMLSAGVGAEIEVKSDVIQLNEIADTVVNDSFTITNIIESGQEFDIEILASIDNFEFNTALNFVSFIELYIMDTREVGTIISEIQAEFKNLELTEEKQTQNFIIYATDEVIRTLTLLEILFFVLMLVSITYSIYTLVKESEEEIFVLRSIGSTKFHIILLFMIQSLFIGVIAGILAIIVGYLSVSGIVAVVSAITGLPFIALNINGSLIGIIFLLSVSLSIVSGIYPSIEAAKIKVIREDL